MIDRRSRERIEKAKEVSIISYLKTCGYKPKKIGGLYATYLSPLRPENNPSFVINLRKNTWADYGSDKKGDIIKLVRELERCSFTKALDILLGKSLSRHFSEATANDLPRKVSEAIKIEKVSEIKDMELIEYGLSRRIDLDVLQKYYDEVHVRFPLSKKDPDKIHICIGFKNDSGGYELRNRYLKVSSSPKDITTIKGSHKNNYVFEGHFNFTSFLSHFGVTELEGRVFVLNGAGQAGALAQFLKGHKVFLWGDNDDTGDGVLDIFIERGVHVMDCRSVYKGFNDFNDWILRDII